MAEAQYKDFDARMARIMRNHEQLSKGYVTKVTRDGLIVAKPRSRAARYMPWRTMLCVLALGLAFKVMMFVNLGPEGYDARVARLAAGTQVEQAGAYLLRVDPATAWLAAQIEMYRQ